MKRVAVYYFSATGNTLRVCKLIKENLEALGAKVDMIKAEEKFDAEFSPENYDTFAVAYPVHGFNAPSNVVEYVKAFPNGA